MLTVHSPEHNITMIHLNSGAVKIILLTSNLITNIITLQSCSGKQQ